MSRDRRSSAMQREADIQLRGLRGDSANAAEFALLCKDDDAGVREAAAEALGRSHKTCVEAEVRTHKSYHRVTDLLCAF